MEKWKQFEGCGWVRLVTSEWDQPENNLKAILLQTSASHIFNSPIPQQIQVLTFSFFLSSEAIFFTYSLQLAQRSELKILLQCFFRIFFICLNEANLDANIVSIIKNYVKDVLLKEMSQLRNWIIAP